MTLVIPRQGIVGMAGQPIGPKKNPAFDEERGFIDLARARLGDLEDIELLHNDVLVVKYLRGKVSESLVASEETQREDRYQGVVGLVLKMGPTAFVSDEHTTFPSDKWKRPISPGDWVLYRSSDGWDKHIYELDSYNFAECRIIQDAHIRARVKFPGRLF